MRDASATASGGAAARSLTDALGRLWDELPGLVNDRIELLTLELRRAGVALVQIVVLIVAASILGVAAWLLLWAAVVLLLIDAGVSVAVSLLVALAVNAAAALWALWRARRLLPALQLAATRRHLHIGAPPAAASPTAPASHEPTEPRPHLAA